MADPSRLRRGDVVLVPFPFADLTDNKIRPAVVISADPQAAEVILTFVTTVFANRSPRGAEDELLHSEPGFPATASRPTLYSATTSSSRYPPPSSPDVLVASAVR